MKVSWSEAGHSWYGGHANSVIQMGLSKWLYLGHARTFRGYLRHKYDHGISVWFIRFQCARALWAFVHALERVHHCPHGAGLVVRVDAREVVLARPAVPTQRRSQREKHGGGMKVKQNERYTAKLCRSAQGSALGGGSTVMVSTGPRARRDIHSQAGAVGGPGVEPPEAVVIITDARTHDLKSEHLLQFLREHGHDANRPAHIQHPPPKTAKATA